MENLSRKGCCFIGHRSEKLHLKENETAYLLYEQICKSIENGYDTFYFGGCKGADIIAAEQVLIRRVVKQQGDPEHIFLIAVIPFEEQANGWSFYWHEKYYDVLKKCDEVITLYTKYEESCYEDRNLYMLQRCDRLIAVYDGKSDGWTMNAIEYAKENGKEIIIIE